jgi:hypothetical protein
MLMGEILLFTNPAEARIVSCRPALHEGEENTVKSPASLSEARWLAPSGM